MCISKTLSLQSFIVGVGSSVLLLFCGNPHFRKENIVFGTTFLFITVMQFFDYLFWWDVNGKRGINSMITRIAPLFNFLQPVFFYGISTFVYETSHGWLPLLVNGVYTILLAWNYSQFLRGEKNRLITQPFKNDGLQWKWVDYMNPSIYLVIFTFNLFWYIPWIFGLVTYSLLMLFLWGASLARKTSKTTSSLWCFLVPCVPLILWMGEWAISLLNSK